MSARVTELDSHIAERCKAFRAANPSVNAAQLARFLGIRYQSYQEYEKGTVSFRVSTVMKLAEFYNTPWQDFIGHDQPSMIPNGDKFPYLLNLMTSLPGPVAGEVVRFAAAKAKEHGVERRRAPQVGNDNRGG